MSDLGRPREKDGEFRTYRELLLRPHFGHIERIKAQFHRVCVFGLHDLHVCSVGNLFPLFDCLPQIAFGPVRIGPSVVLGFIGGELSLAIVCQEMILDIHEFAFTIHPTSVK